MVADDDDREGLQDIINNIKLSEGYLTLARDIDVMEAKSPEDIYKRWILIYYSPTGREFVTRSYDRTVRIFQCNGGHSREIYHTKRMQSCDASYVVSGSDDTNLRLWKAKASEQLGVLLPRERKKHENLEAVKNRYKHLPEVKRIVRHRHLPKPLDKAAALRRTMTDAERRKEERRKARSAPGSIKTEPQRKKRIIEEVE